MLRNRYPFKDNAVYTSEDITIRDSKAESSVCSVKRKRKEAKIDKSFCSLPNINLDE